MTKLSEEAQSLFDAGRAALRPSALDRARNLEALKARLGDAAFASGASEVARATLWKSALLPGSFLGAVTLFAASWWLLRSPEPPRESQRAPSPSSSAPLTQAAPKASAEPPLAASSSPEATSPGASALPSAARRNDRLAEEVGLLSRATSHLNAGRASAALSVLEEHRQRFPSGLLSEERRGARARALCALGRHAEAERDLAQLARQSPQSAQLTMAQNFCGFTPGAGSSKATSPRSR